MAKGTQSSFTAGELTPALHRRPDLEKYISGLKTCKNFFVHPHGGASNRAGTEFICEVKDSTKVTRLIEFAFNTEDTYALELGDQYIRVVRSGGQVLLSVTPSAWADTTAYVVTDHVAQGGINYYCKLAHTSVLANDQPGTGTNWTDYWHALTTDIVEIPTPFLEAELFEVKFVQSADVITICHPNHPPSELSRFAHDKWTLADISFTPTITAPTNVAATVGTGTLYKYVVTAISEDTGEESVASAENPSGGGEDTCVISWTAVAGAESYAVYKEKNGVFGFIGVAVDTSFQEEKFIPEFDDTPPLQRDHFTGAGNYPSNVTYHEQRLGFANSLNKPQNIWLSQTGNFHNFNVSSPTKADDAITLRIDAAQVNAVRNLVSLEDLIILTSGAVHKITSGDSAFSFANLRTKAQSYRGSANIEPIVVDNTVIFIQARGTSVRDIGYSLETDSYKGQPLSILSEHLIKRTVLVDWAYAKEPDSIIWSIRDDGKLLGTTYLQSQEVLAWHQHDTDGLFESVASIEEGIEDAVYFIVNRTINGVQKRYIERLHTRYFATVEDAFFVDCGLTYDGVPADVISGLDHLEGKTVAVLADGNVHPPLVVTSGSITLTYEASKIHIGLPYVADLETLEPPFEGTAGNPKQASDLTIGVRDSRGLWAGFNAANLSELKQREDEQWGDATELYTGYFEMTIESTWENNGQILLRQIDPLPLTILSVSPDYDVGS